MKVTHDDERFMRLKAQEFQFMERCRELVGFQESEDWECPYSDDSERFFRDFATTPEEWESDELSTADALNHIQRCHLCRIHNARAVMAKRIADDPDYVEKKFKEETEIIRALNGKILLALPRADRDTVGIEIVTCRGMQQAAMDAITAKIDHDVLDCASTFDSTDVSEE